MELANTPSGEMMEGHRNLKGVEIRTTVIAHGSRHKCWITQSTWNKFASRFISIGSVPGILHLLECLPADRSGDANFRTFPLPIAATEPFEFYGAEMFIQSLYTCFLGAIVRNLDGCCHVMKRTEWTRFTPAINFKEKGHRIIRH